MKTKLLILAATFALLVSCKEDKKAEETHTPTVAIPKNELQAKIKQLQDSADQAWDTMMYSDDQKLAYAKRLLDEISYTPKYDVAAHGRLVEQVQSLKGKRYTRETMTSAKIDAYDAATDSLLKAIKALVLSTPNVENYPLCNELLNDINALDGNLVMQRVRYDDWALAYNKTLDEQKEQLQAMGGTYAQLSKLPTFQLEE